MNSQRQRYRSTSASLKLCLKASTRSRPSTRSSAKSRPSKALLKRKKLLESNRRIDQPIERRLRPTRPRRSRCHSAAKSFKLQAIHYDLHASWSKLGARPADRPNSQLPLARNLRARMKTKMRHSFSSILKCPTQRSLQFSNCQVSQLKKSRSLASTRRVSNSTFTSTLLSGLD